MEENDVIDMDDTQYDDQPTLEPETTHQTGGFEINTPTVDVDIPVPELESTSVDENPYNLTTTSQPISTEDDQELGSCDCRSECKYNTGKTWKYSDYGFSD